MAAAGVNRVSLGVQSFDPDVLKLLERDHRRPEIVSAVGRLRPTIPNIGFDLIFGIPGQSVTLWNETLDEAIRLSPTHLSTYGLTSEKGMTFYSRLSKGALRRCEEESEREMYALAMDRLPAAGFEQYELSNFARPGFRSRHNEIYWTGLPFFGFGPGAARYISGRRELNHRSVTTWITRVRGGQSPIAESEELSPEEYAQERVMLGLRRCQGINLAEFREQTGFDFRQLAPESLTWYLRQGFLEEIDGHGAPDPRGPVCGRHGGRRFFVTSTVRLLDRRHWTHAWRAYTVVGTFGRIEPRDPLQKEGYRVLPPRFPGLCVAFALPGGDGSFCDGRRSLARLRSGRGPGARKADRAGQRRRGIPIGGRVAAVGENPLPATRF